MRPQHEENFQAYKKAEQQALQIVADMKSKNARPNDIELALLVSIFVLHKGKLPAAQVASIIQGHINELLPFFSSFDEIPS